MTRGSRVVLALGLMAMLLWTPACAELTPEQELRAVAQEIIEAIEEQNPKQVMLYVADEFESSDGLGYPDIQSIVLTYLMRDERVGARLEEISIVGLPKAEVYQMRARVLFVSGASLGKRSEPLPPGTVRYDFELVFSKAAGDWQALKGKHQRL